MRTRLDPSPAETDVSPPVDLDSRLLAALHVAEFVFSDAPLRELERKAAARMAKIVDQFFSVEPADRKRAEAAVLKLHSSAVNQLDPNPQFIWCQSPQAMVVIAKVLNDLHENTRPIKPTSRMRPGSGAKIHAPARIAFINSPLGRADLGDSGPSVAQGLDSLSPHLRPLSTDRLATGGLSGPAIWSLLGITAQIRSEINSNPDTTLYSEEGGNGKNAELVERSLNATEPHLSQIRPNPNFFGRRLTLKHSWLGQHSVRGTETLDEVDYKLSSCCGWVLDYGSFVFMCERPREVHFQHTRSAFSLHNENGPAIRYADGFSVYAINGVKIPGFVIERPHLISTYKINREPNQEVRRVMIDRYKFGENPSGIAAYILDSGAERISHDERWGTLWRFRPQPRASSWRNRWLEREEEEILMLEVVNRSPEPDGTFKHYYLRVPPTVTNSHQAAAWTFGFTEEEFRMYNPLQET